MDLAILQKVREIKKELEKYYQNCSLCPNNCRVERLKGKIGLCKQDDFLKIASINIHKGEEPVISGANGAINIFFSNCTMQCDYCQNYPISQMGVGKIWAIEEVVKKIFLLQKKKPHVLNLVTPTHQIYRFFDVLEFLFKNNFNLPLVYNTSGYEKKEIIELLSEIFKVFLWDIRYFNSDVAYKYSHVQGYFESNISSLEVLFQKFGDSLVLNKEGIAIQGIIIRLLILPNNLNRVDEILKFLKDNFTNKLHIAFMNQYFPIYKATNISELNNYVSAQLYEELKEKLYKYGFENGWVQEFTEGYC